MYFFLGRLFADHNSFGKIAKLGYPFNEKLHLDAFGPVDGRSPAPPGMCKTL